MGIKLMIQNNTLSDYNTMNLVSHRKKFCINPYDLLLISAWLQNGLLYFVGIAIQLITGSVMFAVIVTTVYYCVLIFASFKYIWKSIRIKDILLLFVIILVVLVSYLFNTANRVNIESHIISLFFSVIPFYFLGLSIKANKKTMDMLYYSSIVALLVNWLYIIVIFTTGRSFQEDNLFISYSVLPYVIMILWYTLDNIKLSRITLSILGMLFILSMGSRGPVMSLLVFIVLFALYKSKKSFSKRILYIIIPAIAASLVIYSGLWVDIVLELKKVVQGVGISTRVFDALLYGTAQGSNDARLRIYQIMWQYILERPLTGYGIYGEWAMINYTAHNLVLEIWAHFGIIMGSMLIVTGAYLLLSTYIRSQNPYTKGFILVLVSFGLVRCIYAGSYLSYYIFLMMGFLINQTRKLKRNYSDSHD